MNSKPKTEKTEMTVGQRLLQERETLGLSREIVADRLCLKVCTVREIEEDSNSHNVDPTFLRGYIRSYAKLVKIPEKEILELLDKHTPAKAAIVSPMQSYSLGKTRKKREGWLMKFTWLIIIICIAMVGIWWWQGYKVQKQEIATMAEQNRSNTAQMPADPASSTLAEVAGIEENNLNTSSIANNVVSPAPKTPLTSETQKNSDINANIVESVNPAEVKTVPLPGSMNNSNPERDRTAEASADTDPANIESSDGVLMNFKGECWLEVRDAKGKILFSGIKNAGQKLELNGELPYQFNIGRPANVNLLFKGNSVDLNRFIKANRPAKFKLPGL
ncbi:cytoskeleton protein RodZ [Arsenophonus endosymbiont of Bemisia tabaci]|uniref:cytoskeleton protein RodZ n=1 Tax=Arsenophonus endosymbiont of Bemisia tabaci TaxID=536059 RepID=UPI0015F5E063|nr:cytoskeleton protein RodZ [Arsenophonus endosymbiont of Bemisia tabaci]CAA2929760.1 Cytoskeleton protein RodZ [Arsenophonus endosymbiont of Bemisia tabaci Q2]